VTEPVDTEKGVPDGLFLTSNVHKIHFRPLCPEPHFGSIWHLHMLMKVPVWFNLVLLMYPSYGSWKSLKSPWISFWQMGKNSGILSTSLDSVCIRWGMPASTQCKNCLVTIASECNLLFLYSMNTLLNSQKLILVICLLFTVSLWMVLLMHKYSKQLYVL